MSKRGPNAIIDSSLLPPLVGYQMRETTLCIGLDIAWFGGSKNDPGSRYDFLAVALFDQNLRVKKADCERISLTNHDLDAALTFEELKKFVAKYPEAKRIVLAVDAPLQAAVRTLSVRQPKPEKRTVMRRACEQILNCKRKSIDQSRGGGQGWHPNVQPGAPLAPRVAALLQKCEQLFRLWTAENALQQKLIIECFPAEAIWATKQLGKFPGNAKVAKVKAYKKQKGKQLTARQVTELAMAILQPFAYVCAADDWNDVILKHIIETILADNNGLWKRGDIYPGGKMLDDIVDSLICLATAVSYTTGMAHVWHDPNHPLDGHIIGPGNLQMLAGGPK
jgi:hypothetical protein